MKRIFLILISALALVGCEPSDVSSGRKLWKAYLNKYLKDPSSLVIHNEEYSITNNGHTVEWIIDYGAKNGFGGMGRETLKCETIHGSLFVNGELYKKYDLGL